MRSFAIAAGLFAAAAFASYDTCPQSPACMTMAEAQTVATGFGALIANAQPSTFNASANALLTVNYHDYSDSVIELINKGCSGPATLGQATFVSRLGFEIGQGAQAPIDFEQLNIWHTCDTVIIRWRTSVFPGAPEFVTGLIVMETVYTGDVSVPWKIETVYSEFNSGAWLVDIGEFFPQCSASQKRGEPKSPVRML